MTPVPESSENNIRSFMGAEYDVNIIRRAFFTGPERLAVAIPLQQAIFRNRRQQIIVKKVEKLLSPDYQLCISSLLSDSGPGRDCHGLNLAFLPMDSLIQSMFANFSEP